MTAQGDTNRPRSVNVEFDPDFSATPLGGGALIEQTLRSLGVLGLLRKSLPERAMELTRMRPGYFQIAGYPARTGRRLMVRLSGAAVDAARQRLFMAAFANARRL